MPKHRLRRMPGIVLLAFALALVGSVAWDGAATAAPPAGAPLAASVSPAAAPSTSPTALDPSAPLEGQAPVARAVAADAVATPAGTEQVIGPNDTWSYYYGSGYDRDGLWLNWKWDSNEYSSGAQPIGFGSADNKTHGRN